MAGNQSSSSQSSTCNQQHGSNSERWRYELDQQTTICSYWIKRKQRQCTHRVADDNHEGKIEGKEGQRFCSEHSREGLEELRKIAYDSRVKYECQETIMSLIEKIKW